MDTRTLDAIKAALEDAILLLDAARPEAHAVDAARAEERERRRLDRPVVQVGTGLRGSSGGVTPVGGSEAPRA